MLKIKQVFSPYTAWEDWQCGLWADVRGEHRDELRRQSVELLCDIERFTEACRATVERWSVASAANLTNGEQNRRAWLGQASCCFAHGAPEDVTREAWGLLTESQRDEANAVAEFVISSWEREYRRFVLCQKDQLVFQF